VKDLNNIEDWYRDELEKFNVSPDTDGWKSLSDKLDATTPLTDENISEWYKEEVNKLEEKPDFTVWEKLSTKLDTTSVWDKLVVSLNQYDKFIWWRNFALKGSAVLLLMLGSYLTYNNYTYITDKNSVLSNTNNVIKTTSINSKNGLPNKTSNQQNESINEISNEKITENLTADKTTAARQQVNKVITTAKNELNKNQNNNANEALYVSIHNNELKYQSVNAKNSIAELTNLEEKTIFTAFDRHELTERNFSHLYEKGSYLVKKEKNKIVFNNKRFSTYSMYGIYTRRFYMGANIGLKKQGLITRIKESSALASFNKADILNFGNNFGVTAGYIFSDKLNLETNINLNSTAGYKRNYSLEGVGFNEKLNLNYTTINVLAKKMNTKSTFDNKVYSTNLIGGVYASYLRSSSSNINETTVKSDDYKNTDFGLVLGIEQDRYLSKKLVITPCIRYNQGLTNIANDNSNFELAHNFSLEFNVGIKYIFLKTSK
jgi:hypothetical protein